MARPKAIDLLTEIKEQILDLRGTAADTLRGFDCI
jgi:hypothetical protein